MFITFEGCDYVGKTTHVSLLKQYLENSGKKVFATREPGGTEFGNKVRSLILEKEIEDPLTELFMLSAARREHVKKILEAIDLGFIVISDRFTHSSMVYQGYVKGLSLDIITRINEYATSGLVPDITFLLDLNEDVLFERIAEGTRCDNFYDKKEVEFHCKVRRGFLSLYENSNREEDDRGRNGKVVLIDTSGNKKDVNRMIIKELELLNFTKA